MMAEQDGGMRRNPVNTVVIRVAGCRSLVVHVKAAIKKPAVNKIGGHKNEQRTDENNCQQLKSGL